MASLIKPSWFGREVQVLLVNDKRIVGELTEISDLYIVLKTERGERQVMAHAIITVWPSDDSPPSDAGVQ